MEADGKEVRHKGQSQGEWKNGGGEGRAAERTAEASKGWEKRAQETKAAMGRGPERNGTKTK